MPLVPLYDESSSTQSHNVRAPGGYETWRFCTYDAKQDLFLRISLWNGYLLDSDYVKAYRRYCKTPTRVAPPLPGDYSCQEIIQCYRGGLHGELGRIPAIRSFPNLSPAGLEFALYMRKVDVLPLASSPPLHLTTLNSSHHWQFSNPLAQIRVEFERDWHSLHDFATDSLGFCDHRYGTSPINSDYFIDGCAFFPSGIFLFQATQTTSWIVHLTQSATTLIDQPLSFEPSRRHFWRDAHPKTMALGDSATLSSPRLIDAEFFRLRVSYDAKTGNESGRAFCEVYTRMTWPLMQFVVPRPTPNAAPITWSSLPPADKSSPSLPARAPAPSSSP
jgi:hypothetical protein